MGKKQRHQKPPERLALRQPAAAEGSQRRRARLLSTTALAFAGCLVLGQPAFAVNECGPIIGNSVTCAPTGNPYATGITYNPAADLTMVVEDGVIITPTTAPGIFITSSGGFVNI
ncbi:MAG TPA: hypothetical protein VET25_09985, partial [Aestuariivirgaceae bacterium]|nr:hypothetical protein [Aestuariivirgaceae bacterium]